MASQEKESNSPARGEVAHQDRKPGGGSKSTPGTGCDKRELRNPSPKDSKDPLFISLAGNSTLLAYEEGKECSSLEETS